MVSLRIADIVATLHTSDPALRPAAGGASERFVVADPARSDVTIQVAAVDVLREPGVTPVFDSGAAWRLFREGNDNIFSFHSTTLRHNPYRLARFDAAFANGSVLVTREFADAYDGFVPALQYPLDELLWSNLLARGRGLEIHACGVIDTDGFGMLFPGHSGAGKSTISRSWHEQGATIVSDDRVVIRMRDKRPWLFGTPWHGDERLASPAAAPLKRILFLSRGPSHAVRGMTPATAAARLLACAFPPFHDRAAIDFTVCLLGEVAAAVPCAELAFVPDAAVVPFVRTLA